MKVVKSKDWVYLYCMFVTASLLHALIISKCTSKSKNVPKLLCNCSQIFDSRRRVLNEKHVIDILKHNIDILQEFI